MEVKKQSLQENYQKMELHYKYKELKQNLALQKERWMRLHRQDFFPMLSE
jgi:stearoyl-CoA desaturase (delta-9 desaturase)